MRRRVFKQAICMENMTVTAWRNVINRYLFFEVARTWLVVAGVLLFLTLGLGFARFIADAAAGKLPVDTVLWLALYSAVQNADIVLPISILLAILLTLGRLSRDNEMAALLAGGVRLTTIYRPFITLAVLVLIVAGLLSLVVAPRAKQAVDQLTQKTVASALQTLAPQRFLTLIDGRAVFYAQGRNNATGVLHDVFIRIMRKNDKGEAIRTIITADRAIQRTEPGTGAQVLVLTDGWRYDGQAGQADWRIVQFAEHGVRVVVQPATTAVHDAETASTLALLGADDPAAVAELQVRLSVPISILILTLLALPLGHLPPRAGRYGRIIIGILLYVVYFNLLHIATVWVQTGVVPAILGTWSVHLAMLLFAIGLMLREQGVFVRHRHKGVAA